jgi:hypothetical protein
MAGNLDVAEACRSLGTDVSGYLRAVGWARLHGYIDTPPGHGKSVEAGEIYVTDDGLKACDAGFPDSAAPVQTLNYIANNKVYGDLIATGTDAIVIRAPGLADNAGEITQALAEIQDALRGGLDDESDEQHDAFQQVHTLERELSKQAPMKDRAVEALSALGSLAEVYGVALAPYLDRIMDAVRKLS